MRHPQMSRWRGAASVVSLFVLVCSLILGYALGMSRPSGSRFEQHDPPGATSQATGTARRTVFISDVQKSADTPPPAGELANSAPVAEPAAAPTAQMAEPDSQAAALAPGAIPTESTGGEGDQAPEDEAAAAAPGAIPTEEPDSAANEAMAAVPTEEPTTDATEIPPLAAGTDTNTATDTPAADATEEATGDDAAADETVTAEPDDSSAGETATDGGADDSGDPDLPIPTWPGIAQAPTPTLAVTSTPTGTPGSGAPDPTPTTSAPATPTAPASPGPTATPGSGAPSPSATATPTPTATPAPAPTATDMPQTTTTPVASATAPASFTPTPTSTTTDMPQTTATPVASATAPASFTPTPTPTPTVATTPTLVSGAGYYRIDSTQGAFIEAERYTSAAGNFVLVEEAGRSNGQYMRTPPDSSEDPAANYIAYDLELTGGGTFYIYLLSTGPDAQSDSFWVAVDDGPNMQVATGSKGTWVWKRPGDSITLSSGSHTLWIRVRERGAQVDKIYLTREEQAPTDLGGPALPPSN